MTVYFWRVDLSSGTPRSTGASDMLQTDNEVSSHETEHDRKHDVFISYRRQTGKHLAGSVSPSLPSQSRWVLVALHMRYVTRETVVS